METQISEKERQCDRQASHRDSLPSRAVVAGNLEFYHEMSGSIWNYLVMLRRAPQIGPEVVLWWVHAILLKVLPCRDADYSQQAIYNGRECFYNSNVLVPTNSCSILHQKYRGASSKVRTIEENLIELFHLEPVLQNAQFTL